MANALPSTMSPSPSATQGMKAVLAGATAKYGITNPDFTTAVLKAIGAPVTGNTTSALKQWEAAEGGPSDNPLNTTLGQGSAQGSAIKGYGSVPAGITATTKTLENGLYGGVLSALKSNANPNAIRQAIIASPWDGSNHYAGTTYGAGVPQAVKSSTPLPSPAPSTTSSATPAVPTGPTTRQAITSALLASGGKGLSAPQLLAAIHPASTSTAATLPTGVQGVGDAKAGATPMPSSAYAQLVGEANKIAGAHYNYEWGGGHNPTFAATSGSGHGSGPGVGYDCSGAISALLHAAGKLDQPMVAQQFMSYGQPGPGGKGDITIYASPTHVFAEINGRFFGTSLANPGGGAGWFQRAATAGYAVRHVSLAGAPNMHVNNQTGAIVPYRTGAPA